MLDNHDDLGNTAAFLDELEEEEAASASKKKGRRKKGGKRSLGLTPIQLFVISIEVFAMVAILGMFLMIIMQKMVISL